MKIQEKHQTTKEFQMTKTQANEMVERWLQYDKEMADLVLIAVQGLVKKVNLMQEAFDKKDVTLLKSMTHSLRGVTGSFHMDEVYEVLVPLDNYLKTYLIIDDQVKLFLDKLNQIVITIPTEYDDMVILPPNYDDEIDNKLSVLIGEGSMDIKNLVSNLSDESKTHVVLADSGLEVLELFYMDNYDLLILRDDMKFVNAYEVVETITNQNKIKDQKIIIFSENETIEENSHDFVPIITNPFDKQMLLKKIRAVLEL